MSVGNPQEEKKFVIFSPLSIQACAESVGIPNLSENILYALAEDASYRVREIISKSAQFMSQARRKKLKASDVDKALYWSKVPPVIGAAKSLDFTQIGDVNCPTDSILNLRDVANSSVPHSSPVPIRLTSEWLAPPDQQSSQNNPDAEGPSTEAQDPAPVSTPFTEYYSSLVESILSDNKEAFMFLINDLRSNTKIWPCLPYLVNFLSSTNLVSHDLGKLSWMLYVINALFTNTTVSVDNYLMPLLKSVTYCVLEPLAASINPLNDHWILRDYGSRLLVKIVHSYPISRNVLLDNLYTCIKQILTDPTRPLCSHYGAVMTIGALGYQTVAELLLPNLTKYISDVLDPFLSDLSLTNIPLKEDAHKVYGAIKCCVEQYYFSDHCRIVSEMKDFVCFKEVFGDSITAQVNVQHPQQGKEHGIKAEALSQFMFQYKISVESPQASASTEHQPIGDVFEDHKRMPSRRIVIGFGQPRPAKRARFTENADEDNNAYGSSYPSWNFCLLKMRANRPLLLTDTTQWCL